MDEHELVYYGVNHGYWSGWGEYFKRSRHDIDLVLDIAIKELTGKSLTETVEENIEWLKDVCFNIAERIKIKDDEK